MCYKMEGTMPHLLVFYVRQEVYGQRNATTDATLELLNNSTDIHTLSKQMGNSAAMIERHYSKLTATMAADRLA